MEKTKIASNLYTKRDFFEYSDWPSSYQIPPHPEQLEEYIENKRSMPEVLYHATLPENEEKIREEGIKPSDPEAEVSTDGIHKNRVFLSRFGEPRFMNLPANKVHDAIVLQVKSEILETENTYPDDALYSAWYQGQFRGAEAIACFPGQYRQYCQSGRCGEVNFETWLVDEQEEMLGEEKVNEAWSGRYDLTINIFHRRGELGYSDNIPPEAIQGRT